MKTLELKDITAYLPYGLNVKEGENVRLVVGIYGKSYDFEQGYSSPENGDIDKSKPILRPMSDLTKEITHRGDRFVPMAKLLKISSRFKFDICGVLWFDGAIWLSDAEAIIDKINEWMIDYRGLIPAGLAVDVNTLGKNPYE